MKKRTLLTLWSAFTLLFAVSSCVDDDLVTGGGDSSSDLLDIALSMDAYPKKNIGTRASLSEVEENIPQNVFVMLFDHQGKILPLRINKENGENVYLGESSMTANTYNGEVRGALRGSYKVSLGVVRSAVKGRYPEQYNEMAASYPLQAVSIGNMLLNSPEYWFSNQKGEEDQLFRLNAWVKGKIQSGTLLTLDDLKKEVAYLATIFREDDPEADNRSSDRSYIDDVTIRATRKATIVTTEFSLPDIGSYEGITDRSQGLLMSGVSATPVTVNLNGVRGVTIPVDLQRLDAKVEVHFRSVNPNLRVFPKSWRVHNIPTASLLLADADHSYPNKLTDKEDTYPQRRYNPDNMRWRLFDFVKMIENGVVKEGHVPDAYTGGTDNMSGFVFYMPEVKLDPQKQINASEWDAKYKSVLKAGSIQSINDFTPEDRLRYLYGMRARLAKQQQTSSSETYKDYVTVNPTNGQYYHGGQTLTNVDKGGNFLPFEYAPKDAVWIEIMADVYEDVKDNTGSLNRKRVGQNVVYRLILGGGAESESDINDYNVNRNTWYTYDMQILSLEDIKAEVRINNIPPENKDFEDNSHTDGFVTEASTAILDCHYDAQAVLINYYDLLHRMNTGWENQALTDAELEKHYEVITPFDPAPISTTGDYKRNKTDIDWVSFFVHPYTTTYSSNGRKNLEKKPRIPRFTMNKSLAYTMFPDNDPRYAKLWIDNPKKLVKTIRTWMAEIYKQGGAYTSPSTGKQDEQMRKALADHNFDPETGDMVISVHTREFYYDKMPSWLSGAIQDLNRAPRSISSSNWDNNGWRLFVNRPDRKMKVFFSDKTPEYSHDGHSSWDDAEINVQQHSIMAPYNLRSLPMDYVGFGMEMTEEEDWMEIPNLPHGLSNVHNLREDHMIVANFNGYVPTQGEKNIYDGRLLYLTLVNDTWLQGSHKWKDMLNYTFGEANDIEVVYVPDESPLNKPGFVYKWQVIYPRMINNGHKELSSWAALSVLSRNEPANPRGLSYEMIYEKDVKWFLPSLPQLEYFWMNQNMMSPAYRLRNDIPYITSSRMVDSYDGNLTEPLMFMAKYGATMRQRMAEATAGFLRPWAWDQGEKMTRYHYGYQGWYGKHPEWNQYADRNQPLRVRAIRTLGIYDPNKIYRPAQRYLTESNDWTNDTSIPSGGLNQAGVPTSGVIIDCSRFPEETLRPNYIANGPLPKHTMNSVWARPYKYFRVARLSVIATMRKLGWDHNSYKIRFTTEWGYPQDYTKTQNQYVWDADAHRPVYMLDDSKDENPCATYVEVTKDGNHLIRGWRMPNAYELMLMMRLVPPQHKLDLRRENWNPMWTIGSNGTGTGSPRNWGTHSNDPGHQAETIETLKGSEYNVAYLMSKTDTEEGYRFYGAPFWAQQYGFRARPMDLSKWSETDLLNKTGGKIWLTEFDVRCVKDVSDVELQKYITNQGGSSSHDDFIKPY